MSAELPENFDCLRSSATFLVHVDRNAVWVHFSSSASDFKSVVLIRTLPVALDSFSLPIPSRFTLLRMLSGVVPTLPAKLDSLETN